MLSLTSLTAAEFLDLLVHFQAVWQAYHPHFDLQGRRRRINKFSEHSSMSLKGSVQKLFFVLVYLKQHPTQAYHGCLFSMSQGKVSQWLKLLLPLLEQALARRQVLRVLAGQVLYMDATERSVPRSVNAERQLHEYSGKKGCHTNKNLLLTSQQGRVLYLSATVEGSRHDKALADEAELALLDLAEKWKRFVTFYEMFSEIRGLYHQSF